MVTGAVITIRIPDILPAQPRIRYRVNTEFVAGFIFRVQQAATTATNTPPLSKRQPHIERERADSSYHMYDCCFAGKMDGTGINLRESE